MFAHACEALSCGCWVVAVQGVFPLGKAQIRKVYRGANGFGVSVSSAEVSAGKELVLAMSSERQRDVWFDALERASTV